MRLLPILALVACGCPHRPPADHKPDPRPAIVSVLSLGSALAGVGAGEAAGKDPEVCVALRVVEGVTSAAADALSHHAPTIPAVTVEATECGEWRPVDVSPAGVSAIAPASARSAVALLQTYGGHMTCRDRAIAGAALEWVGDAAGPIAEALAEGVPSVTVPGLVVDLSGCETPE